MAFVQYLAFNGELLPLPDSYEISYSDVESDSGGETEAGTTQRDVVRTGVVKISVSFSVSPKWLQKLSKYKEQKKVSVTYFDTKLLDTRITEMYLDNFQAKLVKDTSYKGLWNVSFDLQEF